MNAELTTGEPIVIEVRDDREQEHRPQIRSVAERLTEQVLRCIQGGTTQAKCAPIIITFPT